MSDLQAKQLEILNEVARIATLDLELRPMLQRITDALANKFDWPFVALVSVDREAGTFLCEAVHSDQPTAVRPGYSRALGSGVVGTVAATEQPIALDDVHTFPNYIETMPGVQSEICVPVKHAGKLVAILNLESTQPAAFTGQLPLLLTVADQIAGAIANAHLYRELKERMRLMEMMSEISRRALDATNVDGLIESVIRYMREHFPSENVTIQLQDVAPQNDSSLAVPIRYRGEVLGTITGFIKPENVIAFEAVAAQIAGAMKLLRMNSQLTDANTHLARAVETLERISATDALTGAANRRHFDNMFTMEWRRAIRAKTPLSLLLIDIDHFKSFNDRHGHQAGDDCLRRVAEALRSKLHRAGDLMARYGGEEFAVLLVGPDSAAAIAEGLREAVAEQGVTISVGVAATIPQRGEEPEALVRRADEALYAAKAAGRNRVIVS